MRHYLPLNLLSTLGHDLIRFNETSWCELTQVRSAICKSSDQDSRENAFQSTFSFAASAVYYNRTKYRGKYLQGNGKGFTITETLLYPVYYNRSFLNRIKRKLEGTSFSLYYIRNFTISSFTIAGSNCMADFVQCDLI